MLIGIPQLNSYRKETRTQRHPQTDEEENESVKANLQVGHVMFDNEELG